ncbi:hypothetical protein [uncultured Clostridium sp.]|uniref:hypothetical protein n=1 Tax=uncultured Clostridium sp. TaxID=59620 RepID=UPI0025CC6A52|nr:hypothetical protein [uncultured Clostridium sp.]
MLKFIVFSLIVMITGCSIVDKIEEFVNGKEKHMKDTEREKHIDIDTLRILENYGLINAEQLKM